VLESVGDRKLQLFSTFTCKYVVVYFYRENKSYFFSWSWYAIKFSCYSTAWLLSVSPVRFLVIFLILPFMQAKNNSPAAQDRCIGRLLLYHFGVNLPVMIFSYPVFKYMGMRSSLPLPSWYFYLLLNTVIVLKIGVPCYVLFL
jgi:hypothetical protein